MLSKRIVAISADKLLGKKLAAGLMAAGGTVETVTAPDELAKGEITADLVVVHIAEGGEKVLAAVGARLKKEASLVAVVADSNLEKVVNAMKVPRVAACMVADELTPASLSGVASKLLYGDVFGLEKLVPWGVKVYSQLVGDYQEKSIAIASVSDFATAMGVRRKYRESIEQCLDEMLMNALYDAPVDSAGKQMFSEVPTKTRISLRMEQKAVVQYACDGNMFFLSVRDSYGALKGETVVSYLDKCLHAEQQIDRKVGGAGLGLYIISNAATHFLVNISAGVATEAVCTFDLTAPKVQLKEFGIFQERIDSSGRLVGGPSKLLKDTMRSGLSAHQAPPSSRGLTVLLVTAIVFIMGLIAIVAYPRFASKPRGSIAITTNPVGATIELDGKAVGTSSGPPLPVGDLLVGQKYKVTARLDGFEPAEAIVEPAREGTVPAQVSLELKPRAPVVVVESDPPGATVVIDGVERGVTPLTIRDLPAGAAKHVTLRRTGYGDETVTVNVPGPGKELVVSRALTVAAKFASLAIESDPPGAEVYIDGRLVAGKPTPLAEEIVVADQPAKVTVKLAGYQPRTQTVTVKRGEQKTVRFELVQGGAITVELNVEEAYWSVDGVKTCQELPSGATCPVANGRHKVLVESRRPFANERRDVEVKGNEVTERVELGIVEVDGPDLELRFPGAPRHTRSAAFTVGRHTVTVVNTKTNETAKRAVHVTADARTRVGM